MSTRRQSVGSLPTRVGVIPDLIRNRDREFPGTGWIGWTPQTGATESSRSSMRLTRPHDFGISQRSDRKPSGDPVRSRCFCQKCDHGLLRIGDEELIAGYFTEEINREQPEGFEVDGEDVVCKLVKRPVQRKALTGATSLESTNPGVSQVDQFTQTYSDPCVYINR